MNTVKEQGELAEARFAVKAVEHGLIVSEPLGDSAPYDRIVDNGSTLFKVQIKSTSDLQSRGRKKGAPSYKVMAARGGRNKIGYKAKEVDFFACHIIPLDIWYVLPWEATQGAKTLNFYTYKKDSTGKYEQYKEAWHLLKEQGNGQD